MVAYFTKDEFGNYLLPPERQRPVFLLGAPGIGKTAIMEQIAQELEVGFVSYSMTHHTRQSALGLPFIATKTYDGVEYQVSEYTMSEIIASVYEAMEATGRREGILFLDELDAAIDTAAGALDNVFKFVEEAFGEGQEMLMLVTDLSVSRAGMAFINDHGCDRYFAHNQNLQFYERGHDLAARIDRITLEEE